MREMCQKRKNRSANQLTEKNRSTKSVDRKPEIGQRLEKSVDPSARSGPGDIEGDVDVVHIGFIVFNGEFLFY